MGMTSRAKMYLRVMASAQHLLHNPASGTVSLHFPKFVEPDEGDNVLVERIFRAFHKMKIDQREVSSLYLPSSMWQAHIDDAYSSLTVGNQEDDLSTFHFFLANFGVWTKNTGVESTRLLRSGMRFFLTRLYLQNSVFYNRLKIWRWMTSGQTPTSRLTYPTFGNQPGAIINGHFVGIDSFFTDIYGSLLSGLVNGQERPVVAELGAGYGRFAYFTLRDHREFCFIDFDLPEVLCLAAYYLMKVYPDKKALLYGEEAYSPNAHDKYDLIFLPPWEIQKMGSNTVALFINEYGLAEMTSESVNNYIAHIANATEYFFHINHDRNRNVFESGESGLLGYEYPLPPEKFTLLFRYPDLGNVLDQSSLDFNTDSFLYLYKRISH